MRKKPITIKGDSLQEILDELGEQGIIEKGWKVLGRREVKREKKQDNIIKKVKKLLKRY